MPEMPIMAGAAMPASFILMILKGTSCKLNFLRLASIIPFTGQLFGGTHAQITCNCQGTWVCEVNGYCSAGCRRGYYGPGCQIRNVAYGKRAWQSSTNQVPNDTLWLASLAVDGYYTKKVSETWAPNCSQTASNDSRPWWQVIIDDNQQYVVDNVTIVNRVGSNVTWLRDFYIYISNDTQAYPQGYWKLCTHQLEEAPLISTYRCIGDNVARSLAIEKKNGLNTSLTLCEVIIGGYEYRDSCESGRAGPGCLSWSCDSEHCTNEGGSCGPRRTCRFHTCPGNKWLPPDCWITVPNFLSYGWWTQITSSEIFISGWLLQKTNWRANSLTVSVSSQGIQGDYSSSTEYDFGSGGLVNVYIRSERRLLPGVTYDVTVTPKFCFQEHLCVDEDCYEPPLCADGVSSDVLKVTYVEEDTMTPSPLFCRCKGAEKCTANGYCQSGCESGFYGPGCVVSNVAYKKKVAQSSTYEDVKKVWSAALAVDGFYTTSLLENFAPNCSHTNAPQENNSWWQVFLDQAKKYAIHQIIIFNRVDVSAARLKNFTIYITNDTTTYPSGSWQVCARQPGTAPFHSSYGCEPGGTRIARSVAIVLGEATNNFLTLCEVVIEAYDAIGVCPRGYTGPRCALRTCDNEECADGGACGPIRVCTFSRCPRAEQLPPDCWLTFSNFVTYNWKVVSWKKHTNITGVPTSTVDLQANSVVLNVFTGGRKVIYSNKFSFQFNAFGTVVVTLETTVGTVYDVSLNPKLCFKNRTCFNENTCYARPDCFEGASSRRFKIAGGYDLASANQCRDSTVDTFGLIILAGALTRALS